MATAFVPTTPIRITVKLRSASMITLGAIALVRPADDVASAMSAVALVAVLTGLAACWLLVRDRGRGTAWWLSLGGAVMALVYGALSFTLLSLFRASPVHAIAAVDAWLLAAAVYAAILTLHVWDHRLPRVALMSWAILNALLAIAGPIDPSVAIAGLLSGGAFYSAGFGFMEMAGAVWLDRMSERDVSRARQATA